MVGWMSQRVHLIYLSAYSPELNLIEILWRQMNYTWLPMSPYFSFDRLHDEIHRLLGDKELITILILSRYLSHSF